MENMKRAISAIMALVLVLGMLPGVPMFAGAEEVETQSETVAVETTEAVTVPVETEIPETTEAPVETVPETTAAAEPVPEETVPETTDAQETVPEETAAQETIPEETVTEETAVVEILEEINASQEAVDGVILNKVTNIAVSASTKRTFVGDKVQLKAAVTPANADIPGVVFYVVEEGSDSIAYNEELLAEKGILMVEEPGTLVIAARATDVDEPHDSATQEKDGTVTVTFVDYTMAINKSKGAINQDNPDGDHWYGEEGSEILRLMTGEKLKLSVHYKTNGVVQLPLEDPAPNVKWYLAEGDEKYASVTADQDNCQNVTVTAKSVTGTKYITLYAKDETLGVVDSISIAVYPVPYKVGIYFDEEEYTNKTLTIPLLASEIKALQEEGKDYLERELTAQVWPLEAEEPMNWTCSDSLVKIIHPDDEEAEVEEGEELPKDTTRATIRVDFREGTSTITISSKNYPDVKSKITIERKWCLEAGNLEFHQETEDLSEKGEGLRAGQSFQLKVYSVQDPNAPELLTSESVKWSLADGDDAYATISKEGKLSAKKGILSGAQVTVKCEVIGNEDAYLELPVTIRPLATEVRILPGDLAEELEDDNSPRMASEEVLNDKTIAVDTSDGRKPFKLGVAVLPNDEYGADQDVTWKSSNTAIATIDKDTEQIVWKGKNGTVTITATANDGSGKKASVKLKFGAQVRGITIVKDDEDFFLRSGESWTFDVNFDPVNPTEKGLTWSFVDANDKQYATLSSGGKLTAKTVYEEHTVTIRATAKDGSGIYDDETVVIKPKKDGILTLKGYSDYVNTYENYVTKTTQTVPVLDSIQLEAYILGYEDMEDVQWKVSSTKTAELSDEIGGSTTVTMLRTGTVTVTATSLNDTSKKATVTLKGIRMTETIEWTHTHEQTELACGKSLTLKAKAYDAEGMTPSVSKLAWSIAEGGEQYAKVSNGKVTAIAGTLTAYDEPVTVTVVVSATDGSPVQESYDITIYPIVQSVVIDRPEEVYVGTNTYVMENPGADTIQMSARVWPENAMDSVTWKTSSKTIAEIDPESGELTCKKAGTVTVTATANDGSGKKATFKMTILLRPTGLTFDKLVYPVIAGGKNLKLKPILLDGNGDKVTGKKLEWNVLPVEDEEDGTAYVTSIAGGTLKTKKVTEPKLVKVTVQTVEKNEEWESEVFELIVWIYPETQSVTIAEADGTEAKASKWCYLEDGSVTLNARTEAKNGEVAFPLVTWTSSNKSIAEVDESGCVTFKKTGTVKITATAADGSGKKDTIQIFIRK